MTRKLLVLVLALGLAVSIGPVASAGNGGKSAFKRAMQFHGTVASVDGDADPATDGPLVVTVTKANGNARRYFAANPGDATVMLAPNTKFYGAADDVSDLASGDAVKVKARNSQGGLVASHVKKK